MPITTELPSGESLSAVNPTELKNSSRVTRGFCAAAGRGRTRKTANTVATGGYLLIIGELAAAKRYTTGGVPSANQKHTLRLPLTLAARYLLRLQPYRAAHDRRRFPAI